MFRKHPRIELAVVVYEIIFMLLAAYAFYANPNTDMFERFSADLHIEITSHAFAVMSVLCVLLSIGVLLETVLWRKRYLYIVAASPLIAYTLPVGYFVWVTGRPGLGPLVYVMLYAAFVLLAFATFRGADHERVNVPTDRNRPLS